MADTRDEVEGIFCHVHQRHRSFSHFPSSWTRCFALAFSWWTPTYPVKFELAIMHHIIIFWTRNLILITCFKFFLVLDFAFKRFTPFKIYSTSEIIVAHWEEFVALIISRFYWPFSRNLVWPPPSLNLSSPSSMSFRTPRDKVTSLMTAQRLGDSFLPTTRWQW